MNNFGYTTRARNLNAAQAEVHTAFKAMRNRHDDSDPATRRWLDAIRAFRDAYERMYPATLKAFEEGAMAASEIHTSDILDFLGADPVCFRSGYLKQRVLRELKRRELEPNQLRLVQQIILDVAQKPFRREFRDYCRLARRVDDARLRAQLIALTQSEDSGVSLRAGWILASLAHRQAE